MRWPTAVVCTFVVVMLVAAPMLAVAQPQAMPPGIMWGTLLGGVTLYSKTGNVTLGGFDRITAVFLPPPQSQAYYPYNPDNGDKFWAVLSAADGTQLARYDFWAQQPTAPYWAIDDMWATDLVTDERIGTKQVPLEPGDYTVDFHLPTGRFYTFSFAVTRLDSDDPSKAQSYWFLEGPWRDWGCLTYAEADPTQSLTWRVFMRNKGREASESMSAQVVVSRDADGSTVCTSRSGMSYDLMREWRSRDFDLVHPTGAMFNAGELLARDGGYTLRMIVDGQLYGTWHFQIANGQLQYAGRTVRGAVDPLEFVEGGTSQWWYIRDESGQAPAAVATGGETAGPTPATGGGEVTAPAGGGATGAPEVIPGASRITINGNTMVPLRSVFEWLGAEVKWIPQALTIIATRGDDDIVMMRLDEDEATVNAKKVPLPQRPVQQNGVTYVPLRFSAEAFGATVGFDAASGAVTITDGGRVGLIP